MQPEIHDPGAGYPRKLDRVWKAPELEVDQLCRRKTLLTAQGDHVLHDLADFRSAQLVVGAVPAEEPFAQQTFHRRPVAAVGPGVVDEVGFGNAHVVDCVPAAVQPVAIGAVFAVEALSWSALRGASRKQAGNEAQDEQPPCRQAAGARWSPR